MYNTQYGYLATVNNKTMLFVSEREYIEYKDYINSLDANEDSSVTIHNNNNNNIRRNLLCQKNLY